MATLRQVREAIADTLSSEFGASWNVADRPGGQLPSRSLIVAGFESSDQTFEGSRTTMVDVWVIVSHKDPSFMDHLDEVLDADETTSIPAAINQDPTLGGVVDSCRVEQIGGYGEREWGGVQYLGANARLEVFH